MLKGNLASFGQSMEQLESFIFLLDPALKTEAWATEWIGVKYYDVYLPFLTTQLRFYSVFLFSTIR